MPLLRPSEKGFVSENLFNFLRLNSMAEFEMKHISFVPFDV
jgi:hypothetical protein